MPKHCFGYQYIEWPLPEHNGSGTVLVTLNESTRVILFLLTGHIKNSIAQATPVQRAKSAANAEN